MAHISDIKLIRTDTTLDLSQKAEKALSCQEVLIKVMQEAGHNKDYSLLLDDFVKILDHSRLKMDVEVPVIKMS
ncbi:hypothetical protein L6452_07563 [Arctium lappa]|uniref:Uncharacterized protein n=1 Tax=Arctium lappa TaxID=4217 RepID=A0ACB9ELR6_ARCLA|nr:hypothetical protein L6452_07563 [Arctium lappa]